MVSTHIRSKRLLIFVFVSVVIAGIALSGAVAAQPSVQTDTVDIDGSEVVVDTDSYEGVGIEVPDGYEISEISDGGTEQPGGAVWQSPPETVSFVLTPPASASTGESVDISVSGDETQTYTLTLADKSAEGPLNEESVQVDGSEISFAVASGASAVAVESFDPENVELSDFSGVGQAQPGGAIWNGPQADTVSFTLTPAEDQEVGDTIVFDVFDGDDTTTVAVEIADDSSPVPDDFVGSPDQFQAIDGSNDGELGAIEIAEAITENGEQGNVNGIEISPIEFAQIIDWNGNQQPN